MAVGSGAPLAGKDTFKLFEWARVSKWGEAVHCPPWVVLVAWDDGRLR